MGFIYLFLKLPISPSLKKEKKYQINDLEALRLHISGSKMKQKETDKTDQ